MKAVAAVATWAAGEVVGVLAERRGRVAISWRWKRSVAARTDVGFMVVEASELESVESRASVSEMVLTGVEVRVVERAWMAARGGE